MSPSTASGAIPTSSFARFVRRPSTRSAPRWRLLGPRPRSVASGAPHISGRRGDIQTRCLNRFPSKVVATPAVRGRGRRQRTLEAIGYRPPWPAYRVSVGWPSPPPRASLRRAWLDSDQSTRRAAGRSAPGFRRDRVRHSHACPKAARSAPARSQRPRLAISRRLRRDRRCGSGRR